MKNFYRILLILIMALLVGCAPVRKHESNGFEKSETEFVVSVLIDLSGSFLDKLAEDGEAYRFIHAIIERLGRERPGQEGRLVVGQISLHPRSILFEGGLNEFRQRFATPEEFANFLKANSNPNGSAVHYSMANSIEYLLNSTAVRENKATPAFIVLSDMADNTTIREEELERVEQLLPKLSQQNGIAALYFVDQRLLSEWQNRLIESGVQNWRVEADVVSVPEPPNFGS